MRFFIRKRRPTPTVIIVALIDILIVLLIFLMVTTTFKQQPALRLALPESTQAKKTGANETENLMVVSVDTNGALRLGREALPVTFDRLRGELSTRAQTNANLKLAINADKSAPVGVVVKLMDAVKEAGLKSPPVLFTKEAGKL
jgi:biopolymer transport protein ExbD